MSIRRPAMGRICQNVGPAVRHEVAGLVPVVPGSRSVIGRVGPAGWG
ncbi:hypothetical protein JOD57_003259 [Geodermatophilus bullaregiensis]|nr:hypothetical protein [Geodermatophilus bullaregiensis]